jgi:O-methyltransferase involved in polyketide biosynthesis
MAFLNGCGSFRWTAWRERLAEAGFDASKSAIVASTGVSMCLTKDAIEAMLRQVAALAQGCMAARNPLEHRSLIFPSGRAWFMRRS